MQKSHEARRLETEGDQGASIKKWAEIFGADFLYDRVHRQSVRPLGNFVAVISTGRKDGGGQTSLKFVAFVLGLLAVFLPQVAIWLAGVVAVLLFCGEVSGIRSGILRSTAESLHRKLDFQNSFEWPISDIELADAVATLPDRARKRLHKAIQAEDYFGSTEPAGRKRAMQNLQESAWWSKHLAGSMASNYCLALTMIGLLSGSIVMLVVSYLIVSSTEPLASVSRVAISVLLLIVSLGLIPLTINYRTFATRCRKSETSNRFA